MVEKLMHYIWQHGLRGCRTFRTVDGDEVEVIDAGIANLDAGPDFFNAKIRIGGRVWAGNVELHVRASDWHRHGHDGDAAYASVILHVVRESDARVHRPDGAVIPQMVLPCPEELTQYYSAMVTALDALPCAGELKDVPSLHVTEWLSALAFERLQQKAARIDALTRDLDGDRRAALYVTLARGLGFGINSEPFERLARQVPLRCLLHHRDSLETIEGALFGHAGMLGGEMPDAADRAYMERLRGEYAFFTAKFGLPERPVTSWKMARMRPHAFPQRRIALLAMMIHRDFGIAADLLGVRDAEGARRLFDTRLSDFWQHHAQFAPAAADFGAALSAASVDTLIINVVAPTLYSYGMATGNGAMLDAAVDILQTLPPENNRTVRLFTSAGLPCPDAFTGQALIQLHTAYCRPRKCLYCRFGHRLLSGRISQA